MERVALRLLEVGRKAGGCSRLHSWPAQGGHCDARWETAAGDWEAPRCAVGALLARFGIRVPRGDDSVSHSGGHTEDDVQALRCEQHMR